MKVFLKILMGWFIITVTYLAVFVVFGFFVSYDSSAGVTSFWKSPYLKPVLGALLTLIPYTIAGVYCGKVLKENYIINSLIVSLVPSIGDKVVIYLFSALIYNINPLLVSDIMYRISSGGDQTAPFFTYGYIMLSALFGNLICVGLTHQFKISRNK